ncbi:occludin [Lepisosteus oculatus]|uniref:Occludin n=1 Tax=Lepisosteus oculatus TaxID=7918 RepID=W5M9V2_LEPOC|nr:PREDICTED: occludin [Lepisosteus oculatus]
MSSKPNGSPPPYHPGSGYPHSMYSQPMDVYGSRVMSQPAYSYYPDDEFLHFYKWNSPPGIIKIMAIIIIILCVGIFACVASTLAWDTDMGLSGFSGIGGSYGSGTGYSGFGGYGGYGSGASYGYGNLGGNYIDPRTCKGFIITMAAICFVTMLVIFILVVSRQSVSRSRKFYLAVIIVAAILCVLMFIATIVYLVGVNPAAQTSGSIYYNQVIALCSQYQNPVPSGVFINQYLYHYCVVEPQEAIAIVFGFLVAVALVVILAFAVITRNKINRYGKESILWNKFKVVDEVEEGPAHVEEWVKNVSDYPDGVVADYPDKLRGSTSVLDNGSYDDSKPNKGNYPMEPELTVPLQSQPYPPHSSSSEMTDSTKKPPRKRRPGRPRRTEGQDYDTDYTTGAESADELDDEWESEFPPIASEQDRQDYKREFDRDHLEYKKLQAEMDQTNKKLSELDRELDELEEGSPQYLDAVDEYHRLKDIKKSSDYQKKKQRCKYLKGKLSHIKKMVSDYDRQA